jgi:hypothetical protein
MRACRSPQSELSLSGTREMVVLEKYFLAQTLGESYSKAAYRPGVGSYIRRTRCLIPVY